MNIEAARASLEHHFGYAAFRPGQEGVIAAVLEGRDALAVMPTGAGKSICYQIPAVLLPGLTLVVSPLVSLMGDQVRGLLEAGIRGSFLNSTLTLGQQATVLRRALDGAYDIMYVAPERLRDERFRTFCQQATIPLVAVDEAHCVSQWGQDFRPSYLEIGEFIASLPRRPRLLALTATATERVREDIAHMLGLRDPYRIVTGFDRPNLRFSVEHLEEKRKLERIMEWVSYHPGDSGIIYCSTRKHTEQVHEALIKQGISATRYHAGLSTEERSRNQRSFVNDDAPVMVATNAFGMGIDKSNVRFVIHHNLPNSLEAYYQEAGRAGRDGEFSECLLMWNDSDIATCRFFIEGEVENEALSFEEREVVRQTQRRLLSIMTGYCLTTECLRAYILSYFGEDSRAGQNKAIRARCDEAMVRCAGKETERGHLSGHAALHSGQTQDAPSLRDPRSARQEGGNADSAGPLSGGCGNCSNCLGEIDDVDVTEIALGLLRCVQELRGRYGKGVVVDVVRGANTQRIRDFGLDEARYYDTLDASPAQLKEIIELLASQGYLEITEGKFPLVGLGPRARDAAQPDFSLKMKRARKAKGKARLRGGATKASGGFVAPAPGRSNAEPAIAEQDVELFERLRALRKSIADAAGKPPYVVFSDATLRDMCARRPSTDEEFLEVNGVGQVKFERYGKQFMAEIAKN